MPAFLLKPIATCDFKGGQYPLPPSEPAHVVISSCYGGCRNFCIMANVAVCADRFPLLLLQAQTDVNRASFRYNGKSLHFNYSFKLVPRKDQILKISMK